jgi:hypothetical protein
MTSNRRSLRDNELIAVITLPPIVTTTGFHWWAKGFPLGANLRAWKFFFHMNLTTATIVGSGCARCGVHAGPGFRWPPAYHHYRWWKHHQRCCPGEVEGVEGCDF